MKLSPLKFFSKFLFLILEEHSSLFPPTYGNSSTRSHPNLSHGRFPSFESLLSLPHTHLQPRGSASAIPPSRGLRPPACPLRVPVVPQAGNKSFPSSPGSSLPCGLQYPFQTFPPSLLSLPCLASCPPGKTEAISHVLPSIL